MKSDVDHSWQAYELPHKLATEQILDFTTSRLVDICSWLLLNNAMSGKVASVQTPTIQPHSTEAPNCSCIAKLRVNCQHAGGQYEAELTHHVTNHGAQGYAQSGRASRAGGLAFAAATVSIVTGFLLLHCMPIRLAVATE